MAFTSKGAVAVLALATLIAACGPSRIVSEVTRYNDRGGGALKAGDIFMIEALDSAKADSLEFRALAGVLAEELERIGLSRRIDASSTPDLMVGLDYRIDDGRIHVQTFPGFSYFRPAVHSVDGRVFYTPRFYYSPPRSYSTLVFTREVDLEMRDPNGVITFEGKATSRGEEGRLPQVFRQMVRAMLFEFPGEDGETIRVEMPASAEEMAAMPERKATF